MQGKTEPVALSNRTVTVYIPPEHFCQSSPLPVVYCLAGGEFAAFIPELMEVLEPLFGQGVWPFYFVLVPPLSWDDEFTPWPAPPAAGRRQPFGGKTDEFLNWFEEILQPVIDARYPTSKTAGLNGLIGYSLGGLTSLYAAYRFSGFGRFGIRFALVPRLGGLYEKPPPFKRKRENLPFARRERGANKRPGSRRGRRCYASGRTGVERSAFSTWKL